MAGPTTARLAADALTAALAERTVAADQALRLHFRRHPNLGRRDRGRLADVVFDVLRHRRLLQALVAARGGDPGDAQALVHASLESAAAGATVSDTGARIAAVEAVAGALPPAVRFSLPDWLWESLQRSYGEAGATDLALALLSPAPVDLRVNPQRASVADVVAALAASGLTAQPIAGLPAGLRIAVSGTGERPSLETLPLHRQGAFEVQDAGSQRIVEVAAPRRGELVVDFCAGAGGKTLAMAQRMRHIGQVLAFDTSGPRLEELKRRAERAGAVGVTTLRLADERDTRLARYAGRADLVLVDAPCSGTGTLRRSPDLKWRMRPEDLEGLVALQARILEAAARLVRPGGRLVYATCSLLDAENGGQMSLFDLHHGVNVDNGASCAFGGDGPGRQWLPGRDDSDGFFVTRRLRRGGERYNAA